MRLRALAAFPLLYAAAFAAVAVALAGSDALGPFLASQNVLVRVLASIGCLAAASGFERGEHLRRAWLWLGTGTMLLLLRTVLLQFAAFQPAGAVPAAAQVPNALAALGNVALLAGIVQLARSWRKAAISLPGGRLGALAVGVVSAGLAIWVAGQVAVDTGRQFAAGDWNAFGLFVSTVTDILSLALIAPLLLTAVAMRGGLFAWPWGLITASQISWLLFDAALALENPVAAGIPLPYLFLALAENYVFAAGLAQLWVMRHVRRAAEAPRGALGSLEPGAAARPGPAAARRSEQLS